MAISQHGIYFPVNPAGVNRQIAFTDTPQVLAFDPITLSASLVSDSDYALFRPVGKTNELPWPGPQPTLFGRFIPLHTSAV